MEDKTFKQAMEQLQGRLENDIYDGLVKSSKAFLEGKTIEEATSWIADERVRSSVKKYIVPLTIHSFISSTREIGLISDNTHREMIAYLDKIVWN